MFLFRSPDKTISTILTALSSVTRFPSMKLKLTPHFSRALFIIGPPPWIIIGLTLHCFIKTISLANDDRFSMLLIAAPPNLITIVAESYLFKYGSASERVFAEVIQSILL